MCFVCVGALVRYFCLFHHTTHNKTRFFSIFIIFLKMSQDDMMHMEEARTSKFAVEKAKWLVSLQPQTVLVSELGPGMCHTHTKIH